MCKKIQKQAIPLIDELLSSNSESRQNEIMDKLDALLPDPYWSEYIFWSDDYLNEDESLNYEKFFAKVFDYLNSEEYLRNERIIELVNRLLKKDFSQNTETDIVNEVNQLSPDIHWTKYIFVDKTCLAKDGSVDKKKFLNKLFDL